MSEQIQNLIKAKNTRLVMVQELMSDYVGLVDRLVLVLTGELATKEKLLVEKEVELSELKKELTKLKGSSKT